MKEVKITCDHCDRDLTKCGPMPDYRLSLKAESIPQTGGISYSVMVYPPIDRDMHFCGLGCITAFFKKDPQ